jgi:hypothetical protein
MFEEIVFVILVLVVIVGIFGYSSYSERRMLKDAQRNALSAKEKIRIAERKFMQGKLRKSVFEMILTELEEELISAELVLFRFRNRNFVSVENKVEQIVKKLARPTKHRQALVGKILRETELLRMEKSLLEGKLLKHEISQPVFERVVKNKESQLIKKEKELADIVASSAKSN